MSKNILTYYFKIVLIILLLAIVNQLTSQEHVSSNDSLTYDQDYFINPVGHDMILAGSFGELRSNHFHAGLDIKPKKYNTSEPIVAAAEGYVSRIKIGRGGYGRVIYIDHPNGYTTVYAHMKSFTDSIEQYVQKVQYELESFEVDIYLNPNEINVEQNQRIGMMGTSGRSFAIHLHYEIRETKTEIPVNPMLFGQGPTDTKYPLINSLAINTLDPDMVALKKYRFQTNLITKGNYRLQKDEIVIPAWNVGVGVHSFDKMDGGNNTNGIYSLHMYVDEVLTYHFNFEKVSFDETKQINAHIDYKNKVKENSTYQNCFQLPGNTMDIYKQNGNGVIKLFKDKPRNVRIEVRDLGGNLSVLKFKMKRDENMEDVIRPAYNFVLNPNVADTLRFGNVEAFIPKDAVYQKHYISCSHDTEKGKIQVGGDDIPLKKSIGLKINKLEIDSLSKYYILSSQKEDEWSSYGGEFLDGSLNVKLNKLGLFSIEKDMEEPDVKIHKFPKNLTNSDVIQVKVYDKYEASGSTKPLRLDVFIDGKWHLFNYKVMTKIVEVNIKDLSKGNHIFQLKVEDDRGNLKEYARSFTVN